MIDYEKKYNEALSTAKKLYNEAKSNEYTSDMEDYERIFPELRESEDERIRKALVDLVYSDVNELINGVEKRLCISWLKKQKEQKPNIEHIQRSWYMEGYFAGKLRKEPRWIIKTDDGGPRYEDNPRHGEDKIKLKPVARENDFVSKPKTSTEILKHYLDWATNDDNDCPYTWEQLANAIKDGIAALEQKPAEWSERDEKILASAMSHIADSQCFDHFHDISKEDIYTWLKSRRPQPHWKPSAVQMAALSSRLPVIKGSGDEVQGILESLYDDLKRLM